MSKTTGRYSPARRLDQVRNLLYAEDGVSVYDIADHLQVSVRTAIRYLKVMEQSGEPLFEEKSGHRKVWRVTPTARKTTLQLTTSQVISLYLSRQVFDFLEGTGFKEDLEDIFQRLEKTLQRKDFTAVNHLDRKLYNINEAPYLYEGRNNDVNHILSALIREDRIRATHRSVDKQQSSFIVDPYTLLVYKKGLYLTGFSHHHKKVRTFALEGFKQLEWRKGDRFDYPEDYHPARLVEGHFGLFGGQETFVRIFFHDTVKRFVQRRRWHPTQKIYPVDRGIELTMRVRGTVELKSWVLSFGDKAVLLEPESLRAQIAEELRGALSYYE